MIEIYKLLLIFCILSGSKGLQLSLDRNAKSTSGGRIVCGVLSCVVNTRADRGASSDTHPDDGNPFSSISSMDIFKRSKATLQTDQHSQGKKVASINSSESRLTRVADGVRVDGQLEAERATIRLEMTKQDDCLAQFVCQVKGKSSRGIELVSTFHLLQEAGEHFKDHVDNFNWTPMMSMQILSLVQQLDTKLTHVIDNTDDWKDKSNRHEHDLISFQKEFIQKINSLEKRLEDKMQLLEIKIVNAVEKLEMDWKFNYHNRNGLSHSNGDLADFVRNGMLALKRDVATGMNEGLLNLQSNVSNASEKGELFLENLSNDIKINLLNVSDKLTSNLDTGVHFLLNRIGVKLQDLSNAINISATETQGLVKLATANDPVGLKREMTELLTPKTCSKGMISVLPSTSLPYVVIQPDDEKSLKTAILCDTFTDGGGWIVFQRRTNGNTDFYRDWNAYKNGFGSLDGNFWLGNEHVHSITRKGTYELRIDLRFNGKSAFAHYGTFYLAGEEDNYAIHVGPYDGSAGDSLQYHSGKAFSTYDKDNDISRFNCAEAHTGAWWYHNCHDSNLNGRWMAGASKGPQWGLLTGADPVSYSEMKIRFIA